MRRYDNDIDFRRAIGYNQFSSVYATSDLFYKYHAGLNKDLRMLVMFAHAASRMFDVPLVALGESYFKKKFGEGKK